WKFPSCFYQGSRQRKRLEIVPTNKWLFFFNLFLFQGLAPTDPTLFREGRPLGTRGSGTALERMPSDLGPPHGHQYLTGWPWGDGGPGPDRQEGGIQSKGPTHKKKAGTDPGFSFWDTRFPSVFPLKGPDAAIDRPGPT